MKGKLAIVTHDIGVRSETFIRRHIENLCPGKTVVLTHRVLPPGEATWDVDCPVFLIRKPTYFFFEVARLICRKLGFDKAENVDVRGIKKFLKEHKVEILWGHYVNVSWPFIKIADDLGIRFFVHALGLDLSIHFRNPAWRRRYADYKYASGVIVLNKIMKERLLSVGIPEEKIHIIPCGVEVPEKQTVRTASDKIHCIAVGRMVGKKAPIKLLESFRLALIENQNLLLDYVGTGPLFLKAQKFVGEHGLQDHVKLHGGQPHEIVIDLLQRADLFLQHSIVDPETGDEEGLPVIILEAMGYGLPVISTKHAGIPEAVQDSVSGYIVDEGDVEAMAQRILELAGDFQKRTRMGQAGWRTARDNFTWQAERARLLDVMGLDE
jgi:colanic acid/amylovoran biosynthesis glycosyltransferase